MPRSPLPPTRRLAYYFPTLAPSLVSTYTDYLNVTLAQLPEKAKLAGIAVGAAAAGQLIASRFGDGRNAPLTTAFGVAPQPPGTWVFAPPPSAQSAQTPWVAAMKPFMLTSADQFRSPAPPAIGSPEYAAGLNEVETMGGATGSARTPAQTATAQFWNANTVNQYNQVFRDVATNHGLDLVDTVRLFAMGDMVGADAGIACMDSKYHYLLWRPITAIRNANLDNNSATTPNATWSPLLTTPNHPEYPSAHGCVSSAITQVLASVLKIADDQHRRARRNRRRDDADHDVSTSPPCKTCSRTSPTHASGPASTTASPRRPASTSAPRSASTTCSTTSSPQRSSPRAEERRRATCDRERSQVAFAVGLRCAPRVPDAHPPHNRPGPGHP